MSFPIELPPALLALAEQLGIQSEEIEEQFVRGSGSGGQKINKTSSAVLLVYRPTGIEVKCQQYREQSKNRYTAYKRLILKIDELKRGKESQRAQAIFQLRKQKRRRSRKAKEKMLEEKHRRGEIKEQRQAIREENSKI